MQSDSITAIVYWLIPGFDDTYRLCIPEEGQPWVESCWARHWSKPKRGSSCRKTDVWKKISANKNSDGYLKCSLTKDKRERVVKLHRIVAAWKFPEMIPSQMVRHLNDVRTDNRPINIAIGGHQENADDAVRNGRSCKGEKNPSAKLTYEKAQEIRERFRTAPVTKCRLAKDFGISERQVRKIISNKSWHRDIKCEAGPLPPTDLA